MRTHFSSVCFVAQSFVNVFSFLEIEQKFHDCEDRQGEDRKCNYDVVKDLTIRTVPVAAARLQQIIGGVNQAVKLIYNNNTEAFMDLLENSHTLERDILSSTTRCIYQQ